MANTHCSILGSTGFIKIRTALVLSHDISDVVFGTQQIELRYLLIETSIPFLNLEKKKEVSRAQIIPWELLCSANYSLFIFIIVVFQSYNPPQTHTHCPTSYSFFFLRPIFWQYLIVILFIKMPIKTTCAEMFRSLSLLLPQQVFTLCVDETCRWSVFCNNLETGIHREVSQTKRTDFFSYKWHHLFTICLWVFLVSMSS